MEMHILVAVTELSTAELQGEVLHDKPRYPSPLTQIYSSHVSTFMLSKKRGPEARPSGSRPAGFWHPVHITG